MSTAEHKQKIIPHTTVVRVRSAVRRVVHRANTNHCTPPLLDALQSTYFKFVNDPVQTLGFNPEQQPCPAWRSAFGRVFNDALTIAARSDRRKVWHNHIINQVKNKLSRQRKQLREAADAPQPDSHRELVDLITARMCDEAEIAKSEGSVLMPGDLAPALIEVRDQYLLDHPGVHHQSVAPVFRAAAVVVMISAGFPAPIRTDILESLTTLSAARNRGQQRDI